MSQVAISVEELSKRFQLGLHSHGRLSEVISRGGRGLLRGITGRSQPGSPMNAGDASSQQHSNEFWALRDLSFDVRQGEVVGIIGRNGAGKSTLLKILSRITAPTMGRFGVRGRVGSLLEVGTGFHPELTGRENIFLSGTILGMKRDEIVRHFDSIVDFAEADKFLDTPVKRYSSGMRVRLGFAVAAHLDPEILIVDEVLAVGDAGFQRKCMGKMGSIAETGRTVLFVSHNMAAIQSLCHSCVVLEHGKLTFRGDVNEGVSRYLEGLRNRKEIAIADREDRSGNGSIRAVGIQIDGGSSKTSVLSGGKVRIAVDLSLLRKPSQEAHLAVILNDPNGQALVTLHTKFSGDQLRLNSPQSKVVCEITCFSLAPGNYSVSLCISANGQLCDLVEDVATLEAFEGDYFGSGNLPTPSKHGRVLMDHHFHLKD